jgi:hypothetical protein
MINWLSKFLDIASPFLARRKGLLPLIGLLLILVNLLIAILFPAAFIAQINLFLHLGLAFAIIGLMLAWAL